MSRPKKPGKTGVNREDLPYRPCVGVMVLNAAGQVFVGRRNDFQPHIPEAHLWQMPQGGIDKGEDPLDAAHRELFEETSIRSVTLLAQAPDWLHYDLPDHLLGLGLKGRYRGQTQRWFAFRFTGETSEINIAQPGGGAHPSEFDDWRWVAMDELTTLVVPFKRPVYEQVVASFRTLV